MCSMYFLGGVQRPLEIQIGKNKLYEGVPGNLVAFDTKKQLIKHYQESLGAIHFRNQTMIIDSSAAEFLVNKYFKSI